MNYLLKIIFSTMLAIFCKNHNDEIAAAIRKAGIPSNAFWVGGAEGGNWYLIENVHAHKNNAFIRVYNDGDGSLIVSKRFILICPGSNHMWIEELSTQIDTFDGEKIYLKAPAGERKCWLQ